MGIKNKCTVSLGSVTAASRAKQLLAEAAIYSETAKLGDDPLGRGCSYGLEFSCTQLGNVRTVLGNAGIRPRGFINDEGEWIR